MWAVKSSDTGEYVIDHINVAFDEGVKVFSDDIPCAQYCIELQDDGMSCEIEHVSIIPTHDLTRLRLADAFIEAFVKMTTLSNTPVFAGDYKQAQDAIRAYRAHVEKEQTDANT